MLDLLNEPRFYVLIKRKPVLVNFYKFQKHERVNRKSCVVRQTRIGHMLVSTVLLSINHGFDDNKPLIFETMIFMDGFSDAPEARCYTHRSALKNHWKAVAKAKDIIKTILIDE